MRFPWLQVDADFIAAHAGDLGSHLGISRREALGLAVDLWTWALARASDDAPPDGMVTGAGPVPDRLLSGSVGWTGPAEQFTEALLACGLAVRIESGYRLTGFDRYKSTWEKNRRRTGGKPEGNRSGTGDKPERKTQTQTQTQMEEAASQGEASPSRPDGFELQPTGKPVRQPRKQSPQEALYQKLQDAREERCAEVGEPFIPDRWSNARQNKDLGDLVKGPSEAQDLFARAWGIYLADEGERARTPAWSLGWFMAGGVRAKYETMAAREEAA